MLKYCVVKFSLTDCGTVGNGQSKKDKFLLQGSIEHHKKQDVLWQLTAVNAGWNKSRESRAGSEPAPEPDDTVVSGKELCVLFSFIKDI